MLPRLAPLARVHLLAPLEYAEFVWAMRHASVVVSDSGGVQEEAPALGVPLLVMRERTERPEALGLGATRLVGTDPDRILGGLAWALARGRAAGVFPYGDGLASQRIRAAVCGQQVREFEG